MRGHLIHLEGQIIGLTQIKTRSACLALIKYSNGICAYNLYAAGVQINDYINKYYAGKYSQGSLVPLSCINTNQLIHAISSNSNRHLQYVRAAGGRARTKLKKDNLMLVNLPSGQDKYFSINNWVYLGRIGAPIFKNVQLGSAGRARHMGFRPVVRGTAMNAIDHPHGGQSGPSRSSVTPWGKPTK